MTSGPREQSSFQLRSTLKFVPQVPNFLKGLVKERATRRAGDGDGEDGDDAPQVDEEEEVDPRDASMYLGDDASIRDKSRRLKFDANQEDRDEDDMPTIVAVGAGDLTADQVTSFRQYGAKGKPFSEGFIMTGLSS